jgi:hypothetical protein
VAIIDVEVGRRGGLLRRAGYVEVRLSGEAGELASLALVCRDVAGSGQPLTVGVPGLGAVTVYRSDRPLQVVALDPRGLLVCADAGGLVTFAAAIARAATAPPGAGAAHRVLLHDNYGTTRGPIGELRLQRVGDPTGS